jgi:AsmA protein
MKKLWWIVGIIAGVIIAAAVALPFLINADQFRPYIERTLSSSLNRQVRISRLDLSIFKGQLSAADISISEDPSFGKTPFVRAKEFETGVEMLPLIFSRQVKIVSITLREPQVVLLRSASGAWNFSSLGQQGGVSKSEPVPGENQSGQSNLSIQKLNIENGRVIVGASPGEHQTYESVNLTASDISPASTIPFQLDAKTPGGGELHTEGQAGPINAADTAKTPFGAKVTLKKFDLASSGYVDPKSGVGGTIDYDGEINSDGRMAHTQGTLNVTRMRLVSAGQPAAQPVAITYASDYDITICPRKPAS